MAVTSPVVSVLADPRPLEGLYPKLLVAPGETVIKFDPIDSMLEVIELVAP
jgi:hypothetical protein